MNIGFSSLAMQNEDLESILDLASFEKIKYVELLNDFPQDTPDLDVLNSYNLNYSVHSPIADLNIASLNKSIRKTSVNEIKKSIKLANDINSSKVVVHPGQFAFLNKDKLDLAIDKSSKSLETCRDFAEDFNVEICVENMPNIFGFLYTDINELNLKLKNLNLSMTLDIGHANTAAFNADEMYFSNVKHIHLSDNNGVYDEHLALGEGKIEIKEIINTFEKNNYKETYMIEVNNKEDILKSLDFLKNL